MKTNFLFSVAITCLLAFLPTIFSEAAESPTCDEGDIIYVSVLVDGAWYRRPDARIDLYPRTTSLGPFPVKADLLPDSPITSVTITYSYDNITFLVSPMQIDNGTMLGEIPLLPSSLSGWRLIHFWLTGYDNEGRIVWLDEIPYTCPPEPYTQGDPYNFIVVRPLRVQIDIKPGSDPNSINLNNHGVVPVAILSDESFDATNVDPNTVRFGPDGAAPRDLAGYEDVDGDGDIDLVLHFKTAETGFVCTDTSARLTGSTIDGPDFLGMDSVQIVRCR